MRSRSSVLLAHYLLLVGVGVTAAGCTANSHSRYEVDPKKIFHVTVATTSGI